MCTLCLHSSDFLLSKMVFMDVTDIYFRNFRAFRKCSDRENPSEAPEKSLSKDISSHRLQWHHHILIWRSSVQHTSPSSPRGRSVRCPGSLQHLRVPVEHQWEVLRVSDSRVECDPSMCSKVPSSPHKTRQGPGPHDRLLCHPDLPCVPPFLPGQVLLLWRGLHGVYLDTRWHH